MKVTICDRCAEQIKGTARSVENKDLCQECFVLWASEFSTFKERFFNPIKQNLLFGLLPKRSVLIGGIGVFCLILFLLVVFRI
jgi:hypothetical protein